MNERRNWRDINRIRRRRRRRRNITKRKRSKLVVGICGFANSLDCSVNGLGEVILGKLKLT